ncbi:phosphotransferase [Deinococcus ficus]|uniref:phosphotransferase n=1 Tax=Deinococcus ficus TaxID=317577 RepID=UPI0023EE237F|nr:phosphotransferase [Deinococcus ficus]
MAVWPDADLVLLHGELSADHLLSDGQTMDGIIDLNGVHLGRPAVELHYLYDSYGEAFVRRLLRQLPHLDLHATVEEVRFMHTWHHVVRLLWALDHDHAPRQERWRYDLSRSPG